MKNCWKLDKIQERNLRNTNRKLYPYIVWLGLKIYELSHRHNEGS